MRLMISVCPVSAAHIRGQFRGGSVAEWSELELEVAEADIADLNLDGSLRVNILSLL